MFLIHPYDLLSLLEDQLRSSLARRLFMVHLVHLGLHHHLHRVAVERAGSGCSGGSGGARRPDARQRHRDEQTASFRGECSTFAKSTRIYIYILYIYIIKT